jgi:predicted transcriptional regulator
MAADSSEDKPTDKKEKVTVYLTKEQKARLDKYAQKMGQPAADSSIARMALMLFLDRENIH